MITDRSNASDLDRIRMADESNISSFQRMKVHELYRSMRKNKVASMFTCLDLKTANADYKITFGIRGKDLVASGIFVYEKERNVYISMFRTLRDSGCYMAFSVHFLNRYAERYLKRNIPPTKSLSYFVSSFIGGMVLYISEDFKIVYATNGGIMLGNIEPYKKIIYMNTFVSLEMLKSSQNSSYGKVKACIDKSCERFARAKGTGDEEIGYIAGEQIHHNMAELDNSEAMEIYSTFFEKGYND